MDTKTSPSERTKKTKWEKAGEQHFRKYGNEITTRNTLFQLEGQVHVFDEHHGVAANVSWYIQPTGLRGKVERSTDGSTDAAAIKEAKRQCDEAALNYARSILKSLGVKK